MAEHEPAVPGKARGNLETLRRFEEDHEREASRDPTGDRGLDPLLILGSPAYFVGAVCFSALWIEIDELGRARGSPHMEAPSYERLQGIVGLHWLLLTLAVLIRRNRMSKLAEHRAHLDLEINLLTKQEVAKIRDPGEDVGPGR